MNRTRRAARHHTVDLPRILLVVAWGLLAVFALGVAAGAGVLGAAGFHLGGLVVAVVAVAPVLMRTGRVFSQAITA